MADLAVHPVADLFPMLADDELRELADSIKQRGLDHPIMLDVDGRVLDGRNRLAACNLVGVKPRFETYAGEDTDDYALRSGITRRHLSTGARAVIAARAAKLNGHSTHEVAANTDLYQPRVAEAGVVLEWAPDFADAVVAGAMPLSKAVEHARDRKRAAEALQAKLDQLRAAAPDLLTHVEDERLNVDDAIAALKAREEKAAEEEVRLRTEEQEQERKRLEEQRDSVALLNRVLDLVVPDYMTDDFVASWADRIGAQGNEFTDRTERAAQVLQDLAKRIKG